MRKTISNGEGKLERVGHQITVDPNEVASLDIGTDASDIDRNSSRIIKNDAVLFTSC